MKKVLKIILITVVALTVILEIANVVYYYRYKKPNIDRINSGGFAPWDLGRSYEYRPWILNVYNAIFHPVDKDRLI